jgi:predicted acyl esterase
MPLPIRDIHSVEEGTYPYIIERNVSVPLTDGGLVRCNIFLPASVRIGHKFPAIVTYGPYGKDVPYHQ